MPQAIYLGVLFVHPDGALHRSSGDVHGRRAGTYERFSLEILTDAEHVPADLNATQHVPVQHPAEAAEHPAFFDAGARAQGAPHALGEMGLMRHAICPQRVPPLPRRGMPGRRAARR